MYTQMRIVGLAWGWAGRVDWSGWARAVVRNNIASSTSFRRLGIAAFVNGSLLALFGLVQAFSANPQTIYWSYPAPGEAVFGPFINRNHFAFQMNVCVGLGAGLLLSRYAGRDRMQAAAGPSSLDARDSLDRWLDPVALGMIFALALMISSMVYSLSRGGFLASWAVRSSAC